MSIVPMRVLALSALLVSTSVFAANSKPQPLPIVDTRIVAIGVEGLMMLATDEVILIAPLADAQRVREAHAWDAAARSQ